MRGRAAVCLVAVAASVARADPPATAPADKSGYSLFRPMPDDQLRAFNPDRPSTTTGPFTVDAGRVQVEASWAQFTHDQTAAFGGDDAEHLSVLPTELRVGVADRAEVDFTLVPFAYQHAATNVSARPGPTTGVPASRVPTTPGHASGFGDLTVQAKVNLFGDDGGDRVGDVAAAAVPYLTLPTASSAKGLGTGRVAGGVILPAQVTLPLGFTFAAEAEFDFPRDDANAGTGFDVLHTALVSHALVGPVSVYGEYVGIAPVRLGHGYQAFADVGLTWAAADNVTLDAAVDLGQSRDAARYTVLAGITVRP